MLTKAEAKTTVQTVVHALRPAHCKTAPHMEKSTPLKRWAINIICWVTLLLIAASFVCRFFPETFSPSSRHRWPSVEVERNTERQLILERIESAGGWAALKRDCEVLGGEHQDHSYRWPDGQINVNGLPPAIAALQPMRIDYFCPKEAAEMKKQKVGPGSSFVANWIGTNVVVRIYIFGAHSTGGHDQPALGLDVLCEPGVANYSPVLLRSETPLEYWTYRKVAEDIYEFY